MKKKRRRRRLIIVVVVFFLLLTSIVRSIPFILTLKVHLGFLMVNMHTGLFYELVSQLLKVVGVYGFISSPFGVVSAVPEESGSKNSVSLHIHE